MSYDYIENHKNYKTICENTFKIIKTNEFHKNITEILKNRVL